MRICKIFLASSSQLQADRREFEIFINRKNIDWVSRSVFLELVVWEDFLDAVSRTRLQDEYNQAVEGCDLFVLLCWTRMGPYSEEEFDTALAQFRRTGRPLIFTYFKEVNSANVEETSDLMTVWNFQERLEAEGHFYTSYWSTDQLARHFNRQLDKLAKNGFVLLSDSDIPSETLTAVRELAISVASATQAILTFTERIGQDATAKPLTFPDDVAIGTRKRLIQLAASAKHVLWGFQEHIVEDLDEWLEMPYPTAHDWKRIVDRICSTVVAVREFLDMVKAESSDFVLESAYDTLLHSTTARLSILEKLAQLPLPEKDDETEAVRRLSARYKTLLKSFKQAIDELARYVKPRVTENVGRNTECEVHEAIDRNALIDQFILEMLARRGIR